jgi:hypothetical protein
MRTTPFLSILAVAALVLAGCSGGSDDGGPQAASPSSHASVGTGNGTVGHIEGSVVNDEQFPVAGVELVLMPLDVSVVSAADGSFGFSDVDEGKFTLLASKLGFEALAQSVAVIGGQTTEVTLRLTPIEVPAEPYHLSYEYNGRITCGFALVPWCGIFQDLQNAAGTPNPTEDYFAFNWTWESVDAIPESQVVEVLWTPATGATGQRLNPLYFTAASETESHTIYIAPNEGLEGPIRLEFNRSDLVAAHEAYPESDFIFGVYPPIDGLTVAQDFTVWRTDFFVERHSEGWSVRDAMDA